MILIEFGNLSFRFGNWSRYLRTSMDNYQPNISKSYLNNNKNSKKIKKELKKNC